ncbi:MAG: 3-keto-5-aminohexanoate cleavage protein [Deltaproteobacteria bacterium]|nr:3-keto-5-aminohexanoate cleavage protein [Deltaproteobacteria bacterium]MBW2025162.1 3-keto-5-aminohexanoate cleavage protein [Deltaproteobacteria bacterium]MBW2125980.1 3-keto-5-aminohexanoate cleavage protein [Deltaproteobacteria bacterium]RLB20713.1 MAG: 3-keto-5-aminohexanoate cleavage protein [Deltaproteobacteria bacterium]
MSFWIKENQNYERTCMITCALSGVVANRNQCPAIPYTPEEYAAEAKRAYDAGAAVVHIHARKPDGSPSYEVEDYQKIYDAVTAECPVIINFSTGAVGIPVEKKIAPVKEIKPAIAALNMGSMTYAKYNEKKKTFVFDFVFANPFSEIVPLLSAMKEAGVKPELECFDSGHVGNCFPLIHMGLLEPPYQVSLIMGVLGGIPPTVDNLAHQVRLLPPNSDWEVIGISHDQWRMVAAAIALGGNVRVGLEDNFYVSPGVMARSNGDLVEKAARMIRDQGREVATVEECRERLKLRHR